MDRPDKLVASDRMQRGRAAGGRLPFPVMGEAVGVPVAHDPAASPGPVETAPKTPPPPSSGRPSSGQTTAGRPALALNVLFGVTMLIMATSHSKPHSLAFVTARTIAEVSRSLWLVALAAAFARFVPGRGDPSRRQRVMFLPRIAGLLIAELAAAFAGSAPDRGDPSRGQRVLFLLGISGLLTAGLIGLLTTGSDVWWELYLYGLVGGVPLLVLAAAAWWASVRPVSVVVSMAILPLTWLIGVRYELYLLGLPELVFYLGLTRVARTPGS